LNQRGRIESVACDEVAFRTLARELVPWADQLAIIAAVDAVADRFAKLEWNRSAQFDSQIRNTAPRVEFVRRNDRLCRTNLYTFDTSAAVLARGRIHRQGQVDIKFAEKKPRTRILADQIGVLADPAQASIARERLLQHRRGIDEGAIAERADLRSDAVG